MAESQIEWTDATWNPVAGCSLASAGCKNCYAMQMACRLEAMGILKYQGLTKKDRGKTIWNGKIREDENALIIPYKWKRPGKIFVNSMSDLFHEKVSDKFILSVWKVMKETPHHNYQILTKRPERMRDFLINKVSEVLPNVWLGTSVENSDAVYRIELLRDVSAIIRFISFEPLIAPVGAVDLSRIHQAIVGGESGNSARPIKETWVDEIHEQCELYNTAFFFKQWGTWGKGSELQIHTKKKR